MHNDSYITPGLIFLAPYQTTQPGPYLYDNKGNLVWSGYGPTGAGPSFDFRLCPYNGSDHLCFFTGQELLGYSRGYGLILDSSYSVVESVQSQAGDVPSDQHEFKVIDGGKSALVTVFGPHQYDLSAYGITGGLGWIMDCSFQEIEIGTDKVLFEWSSLNYVPPTASFVAPNTTDTSGTGLSSSEPWDYFHINSVDKNEDGDYLVSARHTSTVYKISGENGSIIWQIGGKGSDFTFAPGFNFSYQHDARFVLENHTTTVLSIFDNAANGYNTQSSSYSSGMIFAINHTNNSAHLLSKYIAPGQRLSASQGNTQLLSNGNAFVGWGSNAWISEHTPDGNPVLQAEFALTGSMHYRAYKFNFTATPTDTPAAYAYAHDSDTASTTFYMSWNGATEVAKWRIYAAENQTGPFTVLLNETDKAGFETTYTSHNYHAWFFVEALAANGSGLANSSSPVQTFVPSSALAKVCTASQCPLADGYSSDPRAALASAAGAAAKTKTSGAATATASAKEGGASSIAFSALSAWEVWALLTIGVYMFML